MNRKKIAVLGAKGFVGTALCDRLAKDSSYELFRVTRETYEAAKARPYDYLINSAMPSGRFWAKNNPDADERETVLKTEKLLREWHYKKFIQISTVSARTEPDSVYGSHKAAAEKLCSGSNCFVVRLSSMFAPSLSKGVLIDILNRSKVFVDGKSRYPFASLKNVADWIVRNLDRTGLAEFGAHNTVSMQEIADHLGEKIVFEGAVENQAIQNPEPDFPAAEEVFNFMDSMRALKK